MSKIIKNAEKQAPSPKALYELFNEKYSVQEAGDNPELRMLYLGLSTGLRTYSPTMAELIKKHLDIDVPHNQLKY